MNKNCKALPADLVVRDFNSRNSGLQCAIHEITTTTLMSVLVRVLSWIAFTATTDRNVCPTATSICIET
jgi:hypothetical protein